MEEYDLCNVYKFDLSGLTVHNRNIAHKIMVDLPDLSDKFSETEVLTEMFTTPWVLDLFSHIIPIELYVRIYSNNSQRATSTTNFSYMAWTSCMSSSSNY